MNIRIIISVICATMICGIAASAQNSTTFAYASKQDQQEACGTGLHETYDVAIALDNTNLVGKEIKAIEIPVFPSRFISDLKVWIADDLTLELVDGKNTNITDISWDLEYPTTGQLTYIKYDLPEPYVIPEGGTHVGYSLTVNELNNVHAETFVPLQCALATKAGGLYLHTSRSFLDWQDRSELLGCVALTQVYLAGDFNLDAASLGDAGFCYFAAGEGSTVTVPVHNLGLNPIESISYTTTMPDGATMHGTVEYETPIPAVFAYSCDTEFALPEISQLGPTSVTVTIDGVNGRPNDFAGATATITGKALNFVPVHRPVVEEYTGTWCGWCSRGYVAMEYMSEHFPDFIGIAYHNYDPMEMLGGYPRLTTGAPAATVEREIDCDPFYAKGTNSGFKMPELWQEYRSVFVPVGIELEAEYNADGTVTVNSSVEWADDAAPGDYVIEYVLTADDVYDIPGTGNPVSWAQHNYYSTEPVEPYLEWLCSQPAFLVGLHYNDVAILTSGLKGVDGSITDTSVGFANRHSYTFNTAEAVTPILQNDVTVIGTRPIPFHTDKLNVVAMVLDRADKGPLGSIYGRVINSAKCRVTDNSAGVTSATTDAPVESVTFYDLNGRAVPAPSAPGVYIRMARHTDGTVTTDKYLK